MKTVAQQLLAIKAVTLRPDHYFTWTSGIQSPIYCDNRLTMSYPIVRRLIADQMVQTIQERYPDVQVIAGTATAGIPHAAWVSERLDMPMIYVRDAKKKHGKTNQIEGHLLAGQKVVIIEDLISTGLSSLNVAHVLRDAGADVLGVVAIFTYELERAHTAFKVAGISHQTLTNYSELISVAVEEGIVNESDVQTLLEWRKTI